MTIQPKLLAQTREAFAARPAMRALTRACTAFAVGAHHRTPAEQVARSTWPQDDDTRILVRAASDNPIDLTSGAALERTFMPEFIATLTPASAGAQLLASGLKLNFDGNGIIQVPTFAADPSYAAFVADGQPMPVAQGVIEPAVILKPRKLLAMIVMTRELLQSSNVEALMTDALIRSCALALDTALFDTGAATAARAAGLRHNVAALTASGATSKSDALLDDIETLHDAVEDITPMHATFIASPTRALMMNLRSPHGLDPLTVLGSSALMDTKILIAVAPIALVAAMGSVPQIEIGREATVHMEGAAPLPIGSVGTPATVAAPTRSVFQTDSVALKIRFPVTWGLRDARGVAWLTATGW